LKKRALSRLIESELHQTLSQQEGLTILGVIRNIRYFRPKAASGSFNILNGFRIILKDGQFLKIR